MRENFPSNQRVQPSCDDNWKDTYAHSLLSNMTSVTLNEAKRARLRALIQNEPSCALLQEGLLGVGNDAPPVSRRVSMPLAVKQTGWQRPNKGGLGYMILAAAGIAFFVSSAAQWLFSDGGVSGKSMTQADRFADPDTLRYTRNLPADFDLKGDSAYLSEIIERAIGTQEAKRSNFRVNLPTEVSNQYKPHEGRFFSAPGGNLGVALRLRPHKREVTGLRSEGRYQEDELADLIDLRRRSGYSRTLLDEDKYLPTGARTLYMYPKARPVSNNQMQSWSPENLSYYISD